MGNNSQKEGIKSPVKPKYDNDGAFSNPVQNKKNPERKTCFNICYGKPAELSIEDIRLQEGSKLASAEELCAICKKPIPINLPARANRITDAFAQIGYKNLGILGSGSYGDVYKMRNSEGEIIAMKIVPSHKVKAGETKLWTELNHPNITPLLAIYESDGESPCYGFEMPLHKSGLDSVIKSKSFAQDPKALKRVRKWMRNILYGVNYLHENNMAHLDLKTNNILMTKNDDCSICDFTFLSPTTIAIRNCGVPHHLRPPEAYHGKSPFLRGKKIDMWTVGMVFLNMVTGHKITRNLPKNPKSWENDTYQALFQMLTTENFHTYVTLAMPNCKINYSTIKDLRNFILMFLETDPEKRPTAEEALKHKFLQKGSYQRPIPKHWDARDKM